MRWPGNMEKRKWYIAWEGNILGTDHLKDLTVDSIILK